VLDFDVKHDHLTVLAAWEAEHGPLPAWWIETGRGGRHAYMKGDARTCLIPVEGFEPVELKGSGAYVVWPGAVVEGQKYKPLNKRPHPLPEIPGWLLAMIPNTSPTAVASLGDGGQMPSERERFGTPAEYVERLGLGPIENGCISCPAPDHEDATPSCQVRGHNLRCWTHPGGPLTMRARQLVAIVLGVGSYHAGSWCFDAPADRAAVAVELQKLFPN